MYSQKNIDNFWKKVNKLETGLCCWEWKECLDKGYGYFHVNGKKIRAHRFSFQLHHNRLIKEGMVIMHVVCDNPKCVNPNHLSEGTQQDNMTDMVNKGRAYQPEGEKHHKCKLTDAKVLEIRDRYAKGDITQKQLGIDYGIRNTTISQIVRYETWTHI
jgi:hypothetical protein